MIRTISADDPDIGCKRGQDNRTSDLCAQWKAADAAYDAARWGWWQLILACAGLLIGAGTLVAALFAAKYAKDAASSASNLLDHERALVQPSFRCSAEGMQAARVHPEEQDRCFLIKLTVGNRGGDAKDVLISNTTISTSNAIYQNVAILPNVQDVSSHNIDGHGGGHTYHYFNDSIDLTKTAIERQIFLGVIFEIKFTISCRDATGRTVSQQVELRGGANSFDGNPENGLLGSVVVRMV